MECAGKGRGTRCIGSPTRRCGSCGAVAYCSISHQVSHWSDHKEECERLEQQMKRVDELNDFPFTFSQEATVEVQHLRWKITYVVGQITMSGGASRFTHLLPYFFIGYGKHCIIGS